MKVLRSILERPEEASGSIEKQAANAKALSMLAQVYKVSCSADVVCMLAICHELLQQDIPSVQTMTAIPHLLCIGV